MHSNHLSLFHALRLAHAGDKGGAKQELFLPGGLIRNGSQFIETRLARLGIALFEAFFVVDRLLLHELDIERAASARVAVEQIVAGLLGNHLMQAMGQFYGVMNAAVNPKPPTELFTCAESPARKTRPLRNVAATRWCTL